MTKPLYYTFGNHMHWVGMQWLWGYDVLPGSVADMRRLVEETGARGNVNFDAVGYERMAAECPEALADLKAMIEAGQVEPVGCTYGQPYGLFHGGESNIRQLTYGVRATRRLLGVRPRTFWEEEFYFFPQLPQLLQSCGYTGACLFFQWTWHTPEIPRELASLIWWEGIDGSRILTLPRNDLNVHQWPEDFDGLLEQGLINELDQPAIVQWLELMPSRDWMCRSEVLLPRLKELMHDSRFDVRPRLMGELIQELRERTAPDAIPTRHYQSDDVWHGMTLGKNADRHPRTSRAVERAILAAESLSSVSALFGRPYASWDVYPTWELDEAWRDLLAAQHHDNHECEGLCGFVGFQQMERAQAIADEVVGRAISLFEQRAFSPVAINLAGWERHTGVLLGEADQDVFSKTPAMLRIPPFGYSTRHATASPRDYDVRVRSHRGMATIESSSMSVDIDHATGMISQIRSAREEHLAAPLRLDMTVDGVAWSAGEVEVDAGEESISTELRMGPGEEAPWLSLTLTPLSSAGMNLRIWGIHCLPRPDPGFGGALRLTIPVRSIALMRADNALSIHEVSGGRQARRKYPSGDWMTSDQWFETVSGAITSYSFVDLLSEDGSGLLVLHNGAQQWFRTEEGVQVVLCAYDPWDEQRFEPAQDIEFRFIPHKGLRDVERARLSIEFALECETPEIENYMLAPTMHMPPVGGGGNGDQAPIPHTFAPVDITGDDNILCHALYRESVKAGEHLPDWAGHEMARRSNGACTHPFVLRLVEWDGQTGTAVLTFPGEVAAAAKTNLMGEVGDHVPAGEDTRWLEIEPGDPPWWGVDLDIPWSRVRVPMRPHEIATVMADLVMGRKQWRDLDAKREVWATIHKSPGTNAQ